MKHHTALTKAGLCMLSRVAPAIFLSFLRKEVRVLQERKNYSQDLYELGGRIRLLRQEKKLSQQALADIANMNNNTISRYEIAEHEMSVGTFFVIADALDATPNDLSPERFRRAGGALAASQEEASLLKMFREMQHTDRSVLLRIAEMMRNDRAQTPS